MGNKFGNFASQKEAEEDLLAKGFVYSVNVDAFTKADMTSGNLIEAPRPTTAIVEITSFQVSAKYSETGKAYEVFQHHFI